MTAKMLKYFHYFTRYGYVQVYDVNFVWIFNYELNKKYRVAMFAQLIIYIKL